MFKNNERKIKGKDGYVWVDKINVRELPEIPRENKVSAEDMNYLKQEIDKLKAISGSVPAGSIMITKVGVELDPKAWRRLNLGTGMSLVEGTTDTTTTGEIKRHSHTVSIDLNSRDSSDSIHWDQARSTDWAMAGYDNHNGGEIDWRGRINPMSINSTGGDKNLPAGLYVWFWEKL